MFILVKDEIKHLDSCILTLYLASNFFFKFQNVNMIFIIKLFKKIHTHFLP